MKLDEFKALALRHAVGALEQEELVLFEKAAAELGTQAEEILRETSLLPAALALSLDPVPPRPGRKKKILRALQ